MKKNNIFNRYRGLDHGGITSCTLDAEDYVTK